MVQRRFHYEQAFEHFLRAKAIPYIAVDEARRALAKQAGSPTPTPIKSFDFVVYSNNGPNLLVDVKGRKHAAGNGRSLQTWVTRDDIRCLRQWQGIFGQGFAPALLFLFWCEHQPADALFHEVFEYSDRWYIQLAVPLDDYEPHARQRSAKWDTVSIPAAEFRQIAQPIGTLL